ncbi:MAG TPA: hypothetical protein VJV03_09635 [Pyrinomonadaceae bacterium]|nr:hypothetical protein [Pyrinomonadaceae bacterium]
MNIVEAKSVLASELSRYRKRSYAELLALIGQPETFERVSQSGTIYQIEMEVFFDDDSRTSTLRVSGAIDDGGLRAFSPLCDDFLIAPDGSFVGE